MAINWRGGGVFAVGLLLGAVGAVVLVGQGRDDDKPAAASPDGTQLAALTAGAPKIDCSFAPMVAKAGRDDGTLPLDKDLQAASSGTVSALILSGKEAAAAGNARDAEVAFLMACRSAEGLKSDAVPLADAQYQLARHYAQLAGAPGAARRDELLRRAEGLYAASVQAYRQHRGADHEKTRFAMDGLAKLQALKSGPAAQPAVAAASAPSAADDTRISGASSPAPAAAPAPAATVAAPAPAAAPAQAAAPAPAAVTPPKAKPVQEARSTPPEPAPAKTDTPAPAAAASTATEPAGPSAEERQARREEQEAREREAREAREAARAAREVREARQREREEREERAERAAQRAAEREQRDSATELGAPPAPPPPSAPAETVISEPPATASGDIQ